MGENLTIESVSEKVSSTRQKLDELKKSINSLSGTEKAKKTQELVTLRNAIDESKKELGKLKYKTTEESEKTRVSQIESEISQMESEYNQLDADISKSLSELSQDIQNKAKDSGEKSWLGKQWEGLTSKDEWKNNAGTNVVRILGGVGIVGGAVRLGKKIFGKKKKEKSEGGDSSEKKGFWQRPFGKVLKWTGIGTSIYYIAHGIKTGKWKLKDFWDWKENSPTSTGEELYNNYTELLDTDPEKYKEYETLGRNINVMYDKIWDTEINYFGADSQVVMGEIGNEVEEKKLKKNEKFEHVDARGLVPYALDNFYGNVGEMLSYGGVNKYINCKNIEEYKEKIKMFGAEWFDRVMVPFLAGFANFASLGIVKTDTAQQKMDKYFQKISENAGEHLTELDLFFRQYTKVLTYMADKKNAIALQEAKKIISVQGYDGDKWPANEADQKEMLYEAINDSDWVDKNLKGTTYGAFMSSNLVGASKILKNQGLDGPEMTDELQDVVSDVDKKTEKIIGGFENNAIKQAETKLNNGQSLDGNDKNGLHKIAQNVIDDMGDETNGGWLYNTFDYVFVAFDLKEEDKQMILKESGLYKCFQETTLAIQNLQAEIATNPTKENVELLKNLVGQYTSMKKELAVALYAIQEAKEDKDLLDVLVGFAKGLWRFAEHFIGSFKKLFQGKANFGDFINIFAGLVVTGGVMKFAGRVSGKTWVVTAGNYTKKAGLLPYTLAEMGCGHTKWGYAVKHRINDIAKTNPAKAENLMKKKILDGSLSPRQVQKIINNNPDIKNSLRVSGSNPEEIYENVVKKIFGPGKDEQVKLFMKYRGRVDGMVSYHNASLRNGKLNHSFYVDIEDSMFDALKKFDVEYEKLGKNTVQSEFFDKMLKKVNSVDDMNIVNDLVKNSEFKNYISSENVSELKKIKFKQWRNLKESGKLGQFCRGEIKIDELLGDLSKVKGKPVEQVSEIRKMFNDSIDKAILKMREGMDSSLESKTFKYYIDRLEALKSDKTLIDDEAEAFVEVMKRQFDIKILPDFRFLLEEGEKFKEGPNAGKKIGEHLKKLIKEGKYGEFRTILSDHKLANTFKKFPVQRIVDNFDKALKWTKNIGNNVVPLLKSFAKVLAKVL